MDAAVRRSDEDDQRIVNRVGRQLRRAREDARLSLKNVSDRLQENGFSISAAQISRIETGLAAPDLIQLNHFSKLYKIQLGQLLDPVVEPFFVVRKQVAEAILDDVLMQKRRFKRREHSHNEMEGSVYYHVPLLQNDDFVKSDDQLGTLKSVMKKFLFKVGREDDEGIKLDAHSGEEIIYVISGQMDFVYEHEGILGGSDLAKQKKSIRLYAGDVLHFSSQLRHGFVNTGKDDYAEALFVYSDVLTTPDLFFENSNSSSREKENKGSE